MLASLKGIYLCEKDSHNDNFYWGFPQVDADIKAVLTQRSGFDNNNVQNNSTSQFTPPTDSPLCHRYKNSWIYTITFSSPQLNIADDKPSYLKPVTHALSILVDNYNPPAYLALVEVLSKIYRDSASTTTLLQAYLSANSHAQLTSKLSTGVPVTWAMSSFDQRMALIQPIHKILEKFGIEAIVIFLAVLLKKRIIVTGNDVLELTNFTRSVVAFGAWHRKDAQIPTLRPLVISLSYQNELNDIKSTPGCIAGVIASLNNIERYEELWDVNVDLTNNSISINNNSKQYFAMTKFHKSMCEFFIQTYQQAKEAQGTATSPESELVLAQAVIKASMTKEKELIELVTALKDDETKVVSLESIKSKQKVPANLEAFIYNIAVAEGLV